ncbi:MAG TPA: sigma 54-interacting transcriptional regulator [Thermoanaerobaculia bacterium]|jgi:two-component system nitrogen regulation response regulator GlnG|nr:sigma 54-interacting transcriptional regulator [Thermoanaerobaculia bacterium]
MHETKTGLTVEVPTWGGLPGDGERRHRARSRIPALTIVYHPEVRRVGERALLDGLMEDKPVHLSRLEPGFAPPGQADRRPLSDRHLSRSPLLLSPIRGGGALQLSLGESRTRALADGALISEPQVFTPEDVERGIVLELADRIVLLLHTLPATPIPTPERFGLIGESEGILRIRHEIRRIADLEVPVLLRGETGTGKELVARAIHQASRRHGGPCLFVNVAAIPASLAVSELFGSARGSYTSSVRDQAGYFQRAHGGTLFLDEIGEAPPEVQVLLLRVLETGEVQRVGGHEPQRVDVRLIAATDADLERAIEDGRFRAPLLHRLAGYEILVPPLRERRDDFGRLFFHFVRRELAAVGEEHRLDPPGDEDKQWLPSSVVARLARYRWPGNVRQLHNAVRQLVIASRSFDTVQIGPQIERLLREPEPPPSTQPVEVAPSAPEPEAPEPPPRRRRPAPEDYRSPAAVTEAEVLETLRACRWEVKLAAHLLGISRPSLYLLIDKFPGIRKAADLTAEEILKAREQFAGDLEAMGMHLEVSKKGLQQRMKQLGIE